MGVAKLAARSRVDYFDETPDPHWMPKWENYPGDDVNNANASDDEGDWVRVCRQHFENPSEDPTWVS